MAYLVMGVSGSGKSTVGHALARQLHLEFIDADDHHLAPNIAKMSSGHPLTDIDRQEWLHRLNALLQEKERAGQEIVMACSALRESYRQILQSNLAQPLKIIYLHGDEDLLQKRLSAREGHFMPPGLLASQIQTLEIPSEALKLSIELPPEIMVQDILQHFSPTHQTNNMDSLEKASFGIIGMGVMGKGLALNLAGKNENVAVYNRTVPGKEENVAENFAAENPDQKLLPYSDLEAFVQVLELPRKILLMVKAGPAVDGLLEQLQPLLAPGDVVMDGGNSHFSDTLRRIQNLQPSRMHFLGLGISGGEEGALNGPSLMPGGPREGYEAVATLLEKWLLKIKTVNLAALTWGRKERGIL